MLFGNKMPAGIEHLGSKERAEHILKEARKKAQKILEEHTIPIESFVKHRDIQKDRAEVSRLKAAFGPEDEAKKTATVFEAIILEQSELAEWLGPNATTIKTSDYDDYINGVDLVAEFGNTSSGFSHLALGVDVTFGATKLRQKFESILAEIELDTLAEIKYFRSDALGFEGTLQHIPRVVLGISKEEVLALSRLWLTNNKRALAIHPIQHVLLDQMHRQLSVFGNIAWKSNKKNAAERYVRARRMIEEIRMNKPSADMGELKDDKLHRLIVEETDRLKK
jgi:hypothetical protein